MESFVDAHSPLFMQHILEGLMGWSGEYRAGWIVTRRSCGEERGGSGKYGHTIEGLVKR